MNARIRTLACGTALILVAACGRPGQEEASVPAGASATAAVDRAVATAQAIQAKPAAADSILAAYGLTRAGFDSLMYEVAADPEQAKAYTEAMR
ncbi:MAG: hypothetical protein Q8N53_14825 [Longimicrobiales bacterium]|nr:hypothetical protein [Longimicrobiales bacterium]